MAKNTRQPLRLENSHTHNAPAWAVCTLVYYPTIGRHPRRIIGHYTTWDEGREAAAAETEARRVLSSEAAE